MSRFQGNTHKASMYPHMQRGSHSPACDTDGYQFCGTTERERAREALSGCMVAAGAVVLGGLEAAAPCLRHHQEPSVGQDGADAGGAGGVDPAPSVPC